VSRHNIHRLYLLCSAFDSALSLALKDNPRAADSTLNTIVCNNTWLGVSDRPEDKLVLSGEPPERFFPSCFQKDEPGADIFATSYTDKEVCNSCEYTASEDSNNVPLREPGRSFSNVDEKDDPVCRSILHFLAGKLAHKCRRVTGAQERAAGCSGQVTATRTFKKLPDVLMLETRLGVTQEVATSPFRSQIVQGPAGPVHYHRFRACLGGLSLPSFCSTR